MTSPNVDLCGSNNFDGRCSEKKFNVIFVISGVIASFWKVFIKFHWHGQKLTGAISNDDSSDSCVPEPEIKWDQCVNRDESLAGTPDSTIDNTGISLFLGWRASYRTRAIITRSWFETALDYTPRILGPTFLVYVLK